MLKRQIKWTLRLIMGENREYEKDMTQPDLARLIRLRKSLHENAELSGHEEKTARMLLDIMTSCNPDSIVTGLGGNGLACYEKKND